MINQIFSVLYKIKFVFKYYYDEEKKAIIKKPSATELKELLLNIKKIVEKPNITNKLFPKSISCININSNSANFKIGNSSWTKNTTLNTIGMSGELIFESKSEENDKNSLIKNLALIITSSSCLKIHLLY